MSKLKSALAFLEQRYLDFKRAVDKSFSRATYPIEPHNFLTISLVGEPQQNVAALRRRIRESPSRPNDSAKHVRVIQKLRRRFQAGSDSAGPRNSSWLEFKDVVNPLSALLPVVPQRLFGYAVLSGELVKNLRHVQFLNMKTIHLPPSRIELRFVLHSYTLFHLAK